MAGKDSPKDLARASIDGKVDSVRKLLAAGVSPNELVEFGGTAIIHAAAAGHANVVETLLDGGAEIEAATSVCGHFIEALSWINS